VKFKPRTWIILGILYIAYIIYSTLVPFNFSIAEIQSNLSNIEWFKRTQNTLLIAKNFDVIANILFFIPLGIIIYNTRTETGNKRKFIYGIGLAAITGLILSLGIELTQLLIKQRQSSFVDILMNTSGCMMGTFIALIFTSTFNYSNRQKIKLWFRKLPSGLFIILILFISIFINEIIPADLLKSEKIVNIYFNWEFILRPIWIWLLFYVYIPLGILISYNIKNHFKNYPSKLIYFISFIVSFLLIGITELVKVSGNLTLIPVENIISGIFGLFIGLLFFEILSFENNNILKKNTQKIRYILIGFLLLLGSLILFKSVYPLHLNFSREYIYRKTLYSFLSTYSFVPFANFMNLFIYTLQSILLFTPLGIVLNEMERHIDLQKNIYLLVIPTIALVAIAFILKIINEHQIPLLLEVPVNVLGIFSGYFIWYGFRAGKQPL
jgi:glycopeptide antibiotics resistance protein